MSIYLQVNLRHGLPEKPYRTETCPAGAGSLLLEMGLLSRLLGDPVYEGYARRAIKALWNRRSQPTGLLGMYSYQIEFSLYYVVYNHKCVSLIIVILYFLC